MDKIIINGQKKLCGEVDISGMKNAALPIIFACVLVRDKCIIENLPSIRDVATALEILDGMGASVHRLSSTTVEIDCTHIKCGTSQYDLVRRMRASSYLLGAELGRSGHAYVGLPGGCDFGNRPIDQHIKGFEALGGKVNTDNGCIAIEAPNGLKGSNIFFDVITVGATVNIMLAAVLTNGVTTIDNPAREPHIVDLANFLNSCGANIKGAGTDMIKITGVKELHGCTYTIIPDMLEAGTFMIAAVATKGRVRVKNIIPKHLESITAKLREVGVIVQEDDDFIDVAYDGVFNRTNVKTLPYPGFPTDMHPQMAVLLALANGVSYISEGVYENRFRYVDELRRMGASIKVDGRTVIIEGGNELKSAPVKAVDLRAGVSLIIAGLVAQGRTEISEINLIERGYDDIVGKLRAIGADIKKVTYPDDYDLMKAN